MSDCVRFGNWNDTATPANSSGGDGFTFPMALGPTGTGTGTSNPVKIPYQQAGKWWWRVKNWTLAATSSMHSGGVDVTFITGVMDNSGNAIRELDLVQPTAKHGFQIVGSASQALGFNLNPSFILDADLLHVWPALDSLFDLTFLTNISHGSSAVFFAFDITKLPGGVSTGSLTLTMDGVPIDFYYNANLQDGDTFTPGTVTLTATEFWPFAQLKDGLPIYDTATGAVLAGRDPRSLGL